MRLERFGPNSVLSSVKAPPTAVPRARKMMAGRYDWSIRPGFYHHL
jgi:hypothetical protein